MNNESLPGLLLMGMFLAALDQTIVSTAIRTIAYLPALTDCVIMVDGKASLYVGLPRMVEMAIGEKTTLEELGGARMHCTVSGCGDNLAADDADIAATRIAATIKPARPPANWSAPESSKRFQPFQEEDRDAFVVVR